MGNYVRNFNETFDFDGDTVTVTLKQIKRVDAMRLMPLMVSMGALKKGEVNIEKITDSIDFFEATSDILKTGNYIVNIQGMTIENVPVDAKDVDTMDVILHDFYFTGLVATVGGLLIKNSTLTQADEKKSEEQSSINSKESGEAPMSSVSQELK